MNRMGRVGGRPGPKQKGAETCLRPLGRRLVVGDAHGRGDETSRTSCPRPPGLRRRLLGELSLIRCRGWCLFDGLGLWPWSDLHGVTYTRVGTMAQIHHCAIEFASCSIRGPIIICLYNSIIRDLTLSSRHDNRRASGTMHPPPATPALFTSTSRLKETQEKEL